jgi:DNA polymerase/3'-5' exonuclease PolX
MDFCAGVRAMILCKAFGFTETSGKIVKNKIITHGGKAEIFVGQEDFAGFTHIIVPKNATKEYLEQTLKRPISEITGKIVNENWIHDCLIQKTAVDCESYLWTEKRISNAEPIRKRVSSISPPEKKLKPESLGPSSRNFNFHLTKELEKLKNYYEILGDKGRAITYSNIVRTLRLLPFQVESIGQLRNIEGLGEKTLNKIHEILEKGSLQRLDTFRQNERIQVIEILTQVHGIGRDLAYTLYKRNIRTIKALQTFAAENPSFFTETQLSAITLHDEIQEKIPRNEVKMIGDIVINTIFEIDKAAKAEICGSYRRGREMCGDIDVVVGSDCEDLLLETVDRCGIVTHKFVFTGHKFIGVCKANELHRRLDIYACKLSEFWFAVLYFTGSSNYNRMLRLNAGKKGLHLSNTGMTEVGNRVNVVEPKCEEDIIAFLGLPLLSLAERDV